MLKRREAFVPRPVVECVMKRGACSCVSEPEVDQTDDNTGATGACAPVIQKLTARTGISRRR